jgi:hypothetical protein
VKAAVGLASGVGDAAVGEGVLVGAGSSGAGGCAVHPQANISKVSMRSNGLREKCMVIIPLSGDIFLKTRLLENIKSV